MKRGTKPSVEYKEVLELWLKGLTYAEVARAVGLSRQRVQQIVRPPKAVYDLVVKRASGCCRDCGVKLLSGHVHRENHDSEDFNDIENLVYLCPACHRKRHAPRPSKKLNNPFRFVVTKAEAALIRGKAKEQRMSLSEYLREAALKGLTEELCKRDSSFGKGSPGSSSTGRRPRKTGRW